MEPLIVTLTGHLTAAALHDALEETRARFENRTDDVNVIFDCSTMKNYDGTARDQFAKWNREFAERIKRVYIITDKPLWRMVIGAMALAARREMKSFNSLDEALATLREATDGAASTTTSVADAPAVVDE